MNELMNTDWAWPELVRDCLGREEMLEGKSSPTVSLW